MALNDYGTHTIDNLINVLQEYKKILGGDTKVYLSDFEFNGKQTQFEITQVDNEKELFIFYEMHEDLW
jgi:hypothetical protein